MSQTATPKDTAERRSVTITITVAGEENILLRSLIRQALPVIVAPDYVSKAQRGKLADTLLAALSHSEEDENDVPTGIDENSWFDDANEPDCEEDSRQ